MRWQSYVFSTFHTLTKLWHVRFPRRGTGLLQTLLFLSPRDLFPFPCLTCSCLRFTNQRPGSSGRLWTLDPAVGSFYLPCLALRLFARPLLHAPLCHVKGDCWSWVGCGRIQRLQWTAPSSTAHQQISGPRGPPC